MSKKQEGNYNVQDFEQEDNKVFGKNIYPAAQPGAEEDPEEGQVPGHQVLFARNHQISYLVGRCSLREAVDMVSMDTNHEAGVVPHYVTKGTPSPYSKKIQTEPFGQKKKHF